MASGDPEQLARRIGVGVAIAIGSFAIVGLVASARLEHNDNIYAPWQWMIGLTAFAVGVLFVANAPRHPMSWIMLATAAATWSSAGGSAILGRMTGPTWYARPLLLVAFGGWVLGRGLVLVAAPLAYPSGFGRSRARQLFALVLVLVPVVNAIGQGISYGTFDFATGAPAGWADGWRDVLPHLFRATFVVAVVALGDLVVRVVRLDPEARRRHGPMALFALVLALPAALDLAHAANLASGVSFDELELWSMAALPVVLAVGALRRQTLGFRVVVRRATVYGATALGGAAIYAAIVGAFAAVLSDGVGTGPVIATGVVAVSLHPLLVAVDSLARRRLFGDRDDPYRALARLGSRMEATTTAGDALQHLVESVRESLRTTDVSIDVTLEDGSVVRAGHVDPAVATTFPIVHGGGEIGVLSAAPRPREPFTESELRLLADLARAAGPVARAAQLVAELQRSRELLVLAREDERRRLRRDLHDGLGPTLASVALGLDAAASRLDHAPEVGDLLHSLGDDLQVALADIRRLVHGLRPPALDDLGLLPALRQHAATIVSRASRPVQFDIEATGDVDALPAAVEVAAYRIALEAMTNVVRHADATTCAVRIRSGETLEIEVVDDGRGFDPARPAGVGLASMRERSAELGGVIELEPRAPRGVVVRARLPLRAFA